MGTMLCLLLACVRAYVRHAVDGMCVSMLALVH